MIQSTQNQLVKLFRKLHASKHRKAFNLSLLEGSHLLEEALLAGRSLSVCCCTEAWRDRYPRLYEQALLQSERVELVSEMVLNALVTTVNPDGVAALLERSADSNSPISTFGLALSRIQDPGNVGTMIRTAAAAGVEGLWVSQDSVELDHPKVMRSSAGQWFRLPMTTVPNLGDRLQQAKAAGIQIVTTLPQAQKTYWEVDLKVPTLVVMGNEGAGLSEDIADLADVAVTIPLARGVESLNVAIAAALVLYEVQRQRSD